MPDHTRRTLRRALGAIAIAMAAGGAHAAGTVFWMEPRSNITFDAQTVSTVAKEADLVVLRARWGHADPDYRLTSIVKRFKAAGPMPVIAYAWASRYPSAGRSEADLMRGMDLGTTLAQVDAEGNGKVAFLDVKDPALRRRVGSRFAEAKAELGVDGFAIDLSVRTPVQQPAHLAKLCRKEADFCPAYADGMDQMFAEIRRRLGDKSYIAYNGLFNFSPGQVEDQALLLRHTDAAAIEHFGMNPFEKEHSFAADILPFLKVMEVMPPDRAVLAFGRAKWEYSDYLVDYDWQRYLYASFLLAARPVDRFKYHASFQVPTIKGRAGGMDFYADWRVDMGKAQGPATQEGGLFVRRFANGVVAVAPDDGRGGRLALPAAHFTPEGRRVEGTLGLPPGSGAILLNDRRHMPARPDRKVVRAGDMARFGWSFALGDAGGRSIRLDALPDERTGEHDVLLDWERSLRPYRRLDIATGPLSRDARIYVVAEVDDRNRQQDSVVLQIARATAPGRPELVEAMPYRAPAPSKREDRWPMITVDARVDAGPVAVSLDGPAVFEGSGYRFRRWSHVRFVGPLSVSEVAVSEPLGVFELPSAR